MTEVSKKNCFKLLIKCLSQLDESKTLKSETLGVEKKYFTLSLDQTPEIKKVIIPSPSFPIYGTNLLILVYYCVTQQHWCGVPNFPEIYSGLTYSSSSILLVLFALALILLVVSGTSLLKILWVILVVSVLSESFISAKCFVEIQRNTSAFPFSRK